MMLKKIFTRVKHPPDIFKPLFSSNNFHQKNESIKHYHNKEIETSKDHKDHQYNIDISHYLKRKSKLTGGKKGNKQIIESILNNGEIDIHNVPEIVLSKRKYRSFVYLFSREVAQKFSSLIANDLINNDAPVLEIHPGPGFLTESLIKAGVPKIYMYEPAEEFDQLLVNLHNKYCNRMVIKKFNFLHLPKLTYQTHVNEDNFMNDFFEGIERREYGDKISIQIVGTLCNFELPLLFVSPYQNQYLNSFIHGRIVFYVAMLPSMSHALQSTSDLILHRPKIIYLRTMYNYKLLGRVSQEHFFPWISEKNRKKKSNIFFEDHTTLDIVKLEMKPNLFSDDFTKEDYYKFFQFLRLNVRNQHMRIIPSLEKLIPGCGRELIKCNINIYTTFKELNFEELLQLFKVFRKLPEYEISFGHLVEQVMASDLSDSGDNPDESDTAEHQSDSSNNSDAQKLEENRNNSSETVLLN